MISFGNNLLSGPQQGIVLTVQYWRERILNIILIIATISGGVIYYTNSANVIKNDRITLAILFTIFYGWILLITIFRRLPYFLRAGTLLLLLFLMGIISSLQYSFLGDVRIWWIGSSILATIFFGTIIGIGVSIFNTSAYLFIGWLMSEYYLVSPNLDSYLNSNNIYPWVSTSIPFLSISILIILSFGIIISNLEKNLEEAKKLTLELEQDRVKLNQQTSDLERRENQIRTAAEISRTISAELDPEKILQQVVELVKIRFDLYYVGVFLLDESNKFAVLRVGSGEAGEKMIEDGHILAVGGSSMIGWAISHRQARVALDVGEDAVHFQNSYLPQTRSEIALPMVSENNVLGAMSIQSIKPEAFDQDDIVVLQGIADSLAISIENANLFNQVQENLEEIKTLHRQYLANTWADVLAEDSNTKYTFDGIREGITPPTEGNLNILSIPLVLRDQVIGTIEIEHSRERLTLEEEGLVSDIAMQTAQALENARLVRQTERGSQFNRSITDITSKVWSSTSVDTILRTALQELGNTLGASDGLIQLYTPDTEMEG